MFTVGPSATFTPLPANSAPCTAPYWFSRVVSQVEAAATGAGNWVTFCSPSPTPCGPSCKFNAGMHSDEIAGTSPTYGEVLPVPCSIWIFCAWVMAATSWLTRCETGAVEPTQGQVGGGTVPVPVRIPNSHRE